MDAKSKWLKKRRTTTGIAIALQSLYAFEYAATEISAIYYYQDSFNVKNPRFYYGCSMAAIFVSAVITSKVRHGFVLNPCLTLSKFINFSQCENKKNVGVLFSRGFNSSGKNFVT